MLPPQELMVICNQTVIVNSIYTYVQAPNSSYFACSSGLNPYVYTPVFLTHRDCVLVFLLPKLTIRPANQLFNFWEHSALTPHHKREPITAITLAVVLGLGVAGAGIN